MLNIQYVLIDLTSCLEGGIIRQAGRVEYEFLNNQNTKYTG